MKENLNMDGKYSTGDFGKKLTGVDTPKLNSFKNGKNNRINHSGCLQQNSRKSMCSHSLGVFIL